VTAVSIATWEQRFDLYEAADRILCDGWPEFLLHNSVVARYWRRFVDGFRRYQLMLLHDGEILAVINSLPLHLDAATSELPPGGWEWGFVKAIEDAERGVRPNALFGMQVVIAPGHRGRRLSHRAVAEMLALAARESLSEVVIPLRPSLKASFPLLPMRDYLAATRGDGRAFDPWLRTHQAAGGRVLNVCEEAYRIEGSVADWRRWTGLEFPCSGDYVVPGGLVPIRIDLPGDRGTYLEPNVWVRHAVASRE